MTTTSGVSAFAEVNELVAQAGSVLNLKKGLVDAISACEREVTISIPFTSVSDYSGLKVLCLAAKIKLQPYFSQL